VLHCCCLAAVQANGQSPARVASGEAAMDGDVHLVRLDKEDGQVRFVLTSPLHVLALIDTYDVIRSVAVLFALSARSQGGLPPVLGRHTCE
jgi:hypothetical protein